jgi:hypothetical protein
MTWIALKDKYPPVDEWVIVGQNIYGATSFLIARFKKKEICNNLTAKSEDYSVDVWEQYEECYEHFLGEGPCNNCHLIKDKKESYVELYWPKSCDFDMKEITHWMEIPELP